MAGRLYAFSRPRAASELLALILVCLGLGTGLTLAGGSALRGHGPGAGIAWSAALLIVALLVRIAPWWRRELDAMTAERARHYASSALLLFVAMSVSGHILSTNLGFGSDYVLLGPLSRPPLAFICLAAIILVALAVLFRLPMGTWIVTAAGLGQRSLHGTVKAGRRSLARAQERRVLASVDVDTLPLLRSEPVAQRRIAEEPAATGTGKKRSFAAETSALPDLSLTSEPSDNGLPLPPIDIFATAPKGPAAPLDLDVKAQRIEDTLASFNVAARVVEYHYGPVVTQFDIQPSKGVKVRRITELQNDLALALAAPTIRIQAPVPGKSVVGIEIPNSAAATVSLRELLESEEYRSMQSALKVILGKNVAGRPAVIDLARMPHLLIAGATGSGKSVAVNALICCLLYHNSPQDVRLMMIDPKMVELTVYNGVPHLLSPVVTQMDKVVGVLQWAVREMERRYQLFADNHVRNIHRYNEKREAAGEEKLPYLVLIVDELADLMMVAPDDVEESICRLAQLARAAGIHLVIATQRPSVDVITGLIKANFPARIAFAMTSQVDSRTILDTAGAEKLLGRGDMLYQPPDAPKPVRLQGAYLSDQEIEGLVEFWQRSPLLNGVQRVPEQEFVAAERAANEAGDDLLDEAMRVVREFQHASVSLLQRRLKVGYSRAARIMDQLEERGVVGPADGSKQRPVLQDNNDDL